MSATGIFEVNLDPQNDENAPAGRMIIDKKYSGALVGKGIGQMISKRTETCLLYTSPSPRDLSTSRMPSSA